MRSIGEDVGRGEWLRLNFKHSRREGLPELKKCKQRGRESKFWAFGGIVIIECTLSLLQNHFA